VTAVYRVQCDVNRYRYVTPEDHQTISGLGYGLPVSRWESPQGYIYEPLLPSADFTDFALTSKWFATTAAVVARLSPMLEVAGQLLPLAVEDVDEPLQLLNVTETVNALNGKESDIFRGPSGVVINVKRYVFHRKRLPGSSLFKIPETARREVLCSSGLKDSHDEFKERVEEEGLTGLRFTLIWND